MKVAAQKKSDRPDGRQPDELRKVKMTRNAAPAATASVMIQMGENRIICAATIENSIPRWMRSQKAPGGWVSAEYSMLPYASEGRKRREVSSGKVGGRTQEIQRLIGRSMRAVTDLERLGRRTVWIDCDVIRADGGTRTASITGGFAAYRMAINKLLKQGVLEEDPIRESLAAVSVGIVNGHPVLDLAYAEDSIADVDMNVVMTESGRFIELQGTAEENPFSRRQLTHLLKLAEKGIGELLEMQQAVVGRK